MSAHALTHVDVKRLASRLLVLRAECLEEPPVLELAASFSAHWLPPP